MPNMSDKKRILRNIFSLGAIQLVAYALPLITIPYLIHVIGFERIGLIAFSSALVTYLSIVCDYGFSLTGAQQVAVVKEDIVRVSEIYSAIMAVKVLLFILCSFILILLAFLFDFIMEFWLLYALTFGMVFGQALLPAWLFQGLEEMKMLAVINIIPKVILTGLVFFVVKDEFDYIYVPALTSLGFIISAFWALIAVRYKLLIRFHIPSKSMMYDQLRDGWSMFISRIFGSLYRSSNVVILGLLTNNTYVGYYSLAERLVKAIQSTQDAVGGALFPYLTRRFKNGSLNIYDLIHKHGFHITLFYFFLVVVVLIASDGIIKFMARGDEDILLNFRIMSIAIAVGGANYCYGVLGMVALGYRNTFSKYIIATGFFNVIFAIFFIAMFDDVGASIVFVLSETFLLVLVVSYIVRHRRVLGG